jgi:hypothetical protein
MYSLVRQILLYLIFHGDWKQVVKSNKWEFSHSFLPEFQWRNDMLEDVRSGGFAQRGVCLLFSEVAVRCNFSAPAAMVVHIPFTQA